MRGLDRVVSWLWAAFQRSSSSAGRAAYRRRVFVEVLRARDFGGVVLGVSRRRHRVREVGIEEGGEHQRRLLRRRRYRPIRWHGSPSTPSGRARGAACCAQRTAPPCPTPGAAPRRGRSRSRPVPAGGSTRRVGPALHLPQFAVAFTRQVPLAAIADAVAGAGQPRQQRGLADQPVVEQAVELQMLDSCR